ncbi:hypothetical protein KC872_03250 [Candidatus Kaiserbacteria bacterium]|nr:hypothetical protein [Candidatus Kaiserbacteria bacterium]
MHYFSNHLTEKERRMGQLLKTREELLREFELKKNGVLTEDVEKVMKGISFGGDNSRRIRELRMAWSRYHSSLRS